MNKWIYIFDNHKIPRKFRECSISFYVKDGDIEKGFQFASSEEYSKNDEVTIIIHNKMVKGYGYEMKEDSFKIYLKPTEYSLKPFNSVRAVYA